MEDRVGFSTLIMLKRSDDIMISSSELKLSCDGVRSYDHLFEDLVEDLTGQRGGCDH